MNNLAASIQATRFDRLGAVLEQVDPDRVIDVPRIIERQKALRLSDTTVFQLLQLRYQDTQSSVLSALVHIYVLKDAWLLWLRQTEECLRRQRGRRDGSNNTSLARTVGRLELCEFWSNDDGALDALRDGHLLVALIEESLSHTDAFARAPPTVAEHSRRMTSLQYSLMFPSLPAATRSDYVDARQFSEDSASGSSTQVWNDTRDVSVASTSPLTHTTTGKNSRHRRSQTRRGVHVQLKQQEDTVCRAMSVVSHLNELCTSFLSWAERGFHSEPFFSMQTLERSVAPSNKDDLDLLLRLHWLSLALYERVQNPAVVPPPPTVSFLLHTQFQPPAQTLQPDEDNDIAIRVATQFSYFPQSHKLEILSPSPRKVAIRHPNTPPVQYDCVLVENETYVFDRQHHIFRPFWEFMKRLLLLFEDMRWFFEMSPAQVDLEKTLFGQSRSANNKATLDDSAKPAPSIMASYSGRHPFPTEDHGRPTFELTVQTSTIRRARVAPAAAKVDSVVPVSTVQHRRQKEAPRSVVSSSLAPTAVTPQPDTIANGVSAGCAHPASQPVSPRNNNASDNEDDLVVETSALRTAPSLRTPSSRTAMEVNHQDAFELDSTVHSCILSEVRDTSTEASHNQSSADARRARSVDMQNSAEMQYFSDIPHTRQMNFSAEVIHECRKDGGMAVSSHRFRVSGKPIGKGAFGAVYRALDLETGITVAVKQSRYTLSGTAEDHLNWNELQLLSMLPAHPNVITFHGASKELETRQLLLVMEYASGGSIMTMYQDFRPMPERLFFQHAREMALGLKHLHDHGVIHGDVKPENVLTRSNGTVALTDFGCSSVCETAQGTSAIDSFVSAGGGISQSLSGTPPYMAPEVILGSVDVKSDVWAFACTLLQLWLWKLPWSDGHNLDLYNVIPLLFYIGSNDVVPYSERQIEAAPRWLQKIAARAFIRSVEDRCNMAEILSILTSYSA